MALLIAPSTRAQQATGVITGAVTDPSGAPVAGASVTVTDTERGTSLRAQTNTNGLYNFPQLPIGQYSVRVEANGFQTALRSNVGLELNLTATVDFRLTLGQISQTVEVSETAPLLQSQTTEVGSVMEASSIENLPLETGNYNQLTLLVPGAVTISPASFNSGTRTFNAARPNLNGNREQANYYLLDGMENMEFVDDNVAFTPSVEAIQEFQVITNNPSAEYGQFLGGVINVLALGSTTAEYRRWGYPDWFHFATGALEFATAILLALTTTRLLGAGLGAAVMLAAIVTVVFHGEYVRAAPPAIVLVLLAIIAWAVL